MVSVRADVELVIVVEVASPTFERVVSKNTRERQRPRPRGKPPHGSPEFPPVLCAVRERDVPRAGFLVVSELAGVSEVLAGGHPAAVFQVVLPAPDVSHPARDERRSVAVPLAVLQVAVVHEVAVGVEQRARARPPAVSPRAKILKGQRVVRAEAARLGLSRSTYLEGSVAEEARPDAVEDVVPDLAVVPDGGRGVVVDGPKSPLVERAEGLIWNPNRAPLSTLLWLALTTFRPAYPRSFFRTAPRGSRGRRRTAGTPRSS